MTPPQAGVAPIRLDGFRADALFAAVGRGVFGGDGPAEVMDVYHHKLVAPSARRSGESVTLTRPEALALYEFLAVLAQAGGIGDVARSTWERLGRQLGRAS